MLRSRLITALAFSAALATSLTEATSARAAPILAGPASADFDPALAALADGYQRQQDVFAAIENGLSLDPFFFPGDIQTVRDFFAQTATDDFKAFSGKHPYEAIEWFDEYGDEGNFAGVASVGVAARLMVLKAEGAPAAQIARARDAAIRAAKAWHVYGAIGGPGVVARGVRKIAPNDPNDPPFPGPMPDLIPLADANGDPLPADKSAVWRAPVAPGFDGWIWLDDTSKDQVSGYALAAVYLWDALKDDPEAPPEVAADLASDVAAFAKALMKVAPELDIDLCIRDADGRLTRFHDLNPRQLSPDGVLPEGVMISNGFNAALALGIIRAAYHMTGDPEIGKYYYEELIGARDLPASMEKFAGALYTGVSTNYSNVNMLAIALATLGRVETDPYSVFTTRSTLENGFWSAGSDRDASHVKQAWYDVVYASHVTNAPSDIRARVTENLGGFQAPPAFNRDRVNCDDAELAAKSCVGIDGTTVITILDAKGFGGVVVAKDILPMSIRPDSDFQWRAEPHSPNGGAGARMNPGGDYLAAYWLARLSDLDNPGKNVSPYALPPLPYTRGGEGGAGGAAGDKAAPSDDSGCACATEGAAPSRLLGGALSALACASALALRRRRAGRISRRR